MWNSGNQERQETKLTTLNAKVELHLDTGALFQLS